MAEEEGYAVMEDMDFDWLYVEDDYPLSVRISHVWLDWIICMYPHSIRCHGSML
jgi:hypothetical protein